MDTHPYHNLNTLFEQLGLPNDDANILAFIQAHKPLPPAIEVAHAPWWTATQSDFLREAIAENADWAIVIDQFSELLRSENNT